MYPEQGDSATGDAAANYSIPSRFGINLEGVIPLVLIIIIAFFLALRFGVISSSTPIIGPVARPHRISACK